MIHGFRNQLEWSNRCSDEPFWEAVYRQAFPLLAGTMRTYGSSEMQRRGVDRLVYLSNDQILRIEEKKRSEDYPDILLEYISVDTHNEPGWIERDLAIDYVAYAFMPSRTVHLLPWHLLRAAWLCHGAQWKEWALLKRNGFRRIKADNDSYHTYSIAVPIKRLYAAINRAAIIQVTVPESTGEAR